MKLSWGDLAAQKVSERIGEKTATTTTMAAIPADRRVDGMTIIVVADYSGWVFREASVVAASATVIAPAAGSGRWHRCFVSSAA